VSGGVHDASVGDLPGARVAARPERSRFYTIVMWLLRIAGLVALASGSVATANHRPEAFRVTAGAFAAMFLLLAVSFVRMGIFSGRTRGAEWSLLLVLFGVVGWLALAAAAFATAISPWEPAHWHPTGMLVTTALVCLALSFGPALVMTRRRAESRP
jgi:hypothetical protein